MLRDLTGQRFGRLIVLKLDSIRNHRSYWLCRCDCGTEKAIYRSCLTSGDTQSCGCQKRENVSKRQKTHGLSKKPLCQVYLNMIARCTKKHNPAYPLYGGRGIAVCKSWLDSYDQFVADMGHRPNGSTLERIDNDGDYCPDNCKWATKQEQANNRRSNTRWTLNGETHTVQEWSRITGIKHTTLHQRVKQYGWSIERALTT